MLAFLTRFARLFVFAHLRLSVRLCLVPVVACDILSIVSLVVSSLRLARRLVACLLIPFPPRGRLAHASRLASRYLRLVALFGHPCLVPRLVVYLVLLPSAIPIVLLPHHATGLCVLSVPYENPTPPGNHK